MNVPQFEAPLLLTRHANLTAEDIVEEMQEQALHAASEDLAEPAPVDRPQDMQAASLSSLLALNGTAFVERAYATVLHRPADPNGLTHYVGQLARGARSKIEILGALRYGHEGRKVGVRIPGLLSRYVVLRACRLPAIGRPFGLAVRAISWPHRARRTQWELLASMAGLRQTTDGLQGVIASLERRLEPLVAEHLSGSTDRRLKDAEQRLTALAMDNWAEPLIALSAQLDEQVRRTRQLELQAQDILAVAAVLRALRAEHSWPEEDGAAFAARLAALSRDTVRRAAQADENTQRNRAELLDQSRRLGLLLEDVRRRLNQPFTPEEAARLDEADDHRLDSLYVAFEDRFRGSREEIRERQRAHLPLLHETEAGSSERPIVDVGAGRGEWLEVLREEGLQATGVDLNESMVELCRGLGLACVQDDAVNYLRRMADNSLGAVTGFHIIEHLPFKAFVALLDESLRVLKPGGLILFETPNPANLMVGSRWFYLDPTHRNPMPGEMTAMVAEARGFVQVEIRELHPTLARFQARDEILADQLDRMFHGPQDYALVARKV